MLIKISRYAKLISKIFNPIGAKKNTNTSQELSAEELQQRDKDRIKLYVDLCHHELVYDFRKLVAQNKNVNSSVLLAEFCQEKIAQLTLQHLSKEDALSYLMTEIESRYQHLLNKPLTPVDQEKLMRKQLESIIQGGWGAIPEEQVEKALVYLQAIDDEQAKPMLEEIMLDVKGSLDRQLNNPTGSGHQSEVIQEYRSAYYTCKILIEHYSKKDRV